MGDPLAGGRQALPTGTVTFLYTDIEGSTRRWEQHPAAMKAAVERHDAILRAAIEGQGGVVFRTMGDAFCAAFSTPQQAAGAALAAQRALNAEPWAEEIAPIKVRMALHTGTGEVGGGDYIGPPLNRVARLLSAGYGGQVLVSSPAFDLTRGALPPDVSLRDLGERLLKDLQYPEHVYQLVVSDLPADFPPLKTLDTRPNNLPIQRSPLIGREAELATISQLLLRKDVGLLTLTGHERSGGQVSARPAWPCRQPPTRKISSRTACSSCPWRISSTPHWWPHQSPRSSGWTNRGAGLCLRASLLLPGIRGQGSGIRSDSQTLIPGP